MLGKWSAFTHFLEQRFCHAPSDDHVKLNFHKYNFKEYNLFLIVFNRKIFTLQFYTDYIEQKSYNNKYDIYGGSKRVVVSVNLCIQTSALTNCWDRACPQYSSPGHGENREDILSGLLTASKIPSHMHLGSRAHARNKNKHDIGVGLFSYVMLIIIRNFIL